MTRQLIEIEEARGRVLERVPRLDSEPVALRAALGRVLAEDVRSSEPVPRFDNSAMDGFAVRAADTGGANPGQPVELALVDESRAGRPAEAALQQGEAIAISTGAALPAGADAVVRVEDTGRTDAGIAVSAEVEPGRDIRRAGEDISAGETVIEAGAMLGAAELGVLASLDFAEPLCAVTPRLSLLTTGDELIELGEQARPGAVRNTNAYALPPLAEEAGAEVVSIAKVGDDAAATTQAIESMLECDLAVICGGVSVGEHDHVKRALAELGVEQVFWGVALRPGRPTWFGVARSGALVFGLPGNPVSAVVTFVLFARPALRAMQGADPAAVRVAATLAEDYRKRPGRAHAVRCTLTPDGDGLRARPTGPQGSHVLTSMLGADGLAIIPADSAGAEAGERVEVELLPGRLSSGR
jgi:molybdopterin molybdotransferase